MSTERTIAEVVAPTPVVEGAGVRLRRSIATRHLDYLDPFLLFDHFGSDDPDDYVAGFPVHPHRGIETVTYMLGGSVAHKDSLGNSGVIGAGDVQWMTAGSGILHEEMPKVGPWRLDGFQVWVNLPAKLKMTRPRYQDVAAAKIPLRMRPDGIEIRVVAGEVDGVRTPRSRTSSRARSRSATPRTRATARSRRHGSSSSATGTSSGPGPGRSRDASSSSPGSRSGSPSRATVRSS